MKKELSEKTECVIRDLYQNKEREAIRKVAELLPEYQNLIQKMLVEWKDDRALFFLEGLKLLVENYQAQDMMGMADCISEYMLSMITFYDENYSEAFY